MESIYLNHRFGAEFEYTGITRSQTAYILFKFFQREVVHKHTSKGYISHRIRDQKGRLWCVAYDTSIHAQKIVNGQVVDAEEQYRVELITPPLRYDEDIKLLTNIIRAIKEKGAFVNNSCGIHIHLDGKGHDAQSIKNFCNIIASRLSLFDLALETDEDRRKKYCKDLDKSFIQSINSVSSPTMDLIEAAWYQKWQWDDHRSRYCFLNLHCYFSGNKTLELRCFNGSLDADKVQAYIVFALGLNYLAMTTKYTWYRLVKTSNPRYTMIHFLQRIGLKGPEFARCRELLASHLPGDPNWR